MCGLIMRSYNTKIKNVAAVIYIVAKSPICPSPLAKFLESL